MKAKIEGKAYDTAKAEVIATHDNGLPKNDLDYIREGLYKIDLPAGSLRGVNVTDMPEELLAHRTLEEARTLGVGWGDCYPVCYGDDLCIDDVLDSNGRLLWGNGTGDDLVIDESYEYARPNAEEEKEDLAYESLCIEQE